MFHHHLHFHSHDALSQYQRVAIQRTRRTFQTQKWKWGLTVAEYGDFAESPKSVIQGVYESCMMLALVEYTYDYGYIIHVRMGGFYLTNLLVYATLTLCLDFILRCISSLQLYHTNRPRSKLYGFVAQAVALGVDGRFFGTVRTGKSIGRSSLGLGFLAQARCIRNMVHEGFSSALHSKQWDNSMCGKLGL